MFAAAWKNSEICRLFDLRKMDRAAAEIHNA